MVLAYPAFCTLLEEGEQEEQAALLVGSEFSIEPSELLSFHHDRVLHDHFVIKGVHYTTVYQFSLAHINWEMDNRGWIADGPDGRVIILSNHARPYVADVSELRAIKRRTTGWLEEQGDAFIHLAGL